MTAPASGRTRHHLRSGLRTAKGKKRISYCCSSQPYVAEWDENRVLVWKIRRVRTRYALNFAVKSASFADCWRSVSVSSKPQSGSKAIEEKYQQRIDSCKKIDNIATEVLGSWTSSLLRKVRFGITTEIASVSFKYRRWNSPKSSFKFRKLEFFRFENFQNFNSTPLFPHQCSSNAGKMQTNRAGLMNIPLCALFASIFPGQLPGQRSVSGLTFRSRILFLYFMNLFYFYLSRSLIWWCFQGTIWGRGQGKSYLGATPTTAEPRRLRTDKSNHSSK